MWWHQYPLAQLLLREQNLVEFTWTASMIFSIIAPWVIWQDFECNYKFIIAHISCTLPCNSTMRLWWSPMLSDKVVEVIYPCLSWLVGNDHIMINTVLIYKKFSGNVCFQKYYVSLYMKRTCRWESGCFLV